MNWLPRNIPVEANTRIRAEFRGRPDWIAVRVIHTDEDSWREGALPYSRVWLRKGH